MSGELFGWMRVRRNAIGKLILAKVFKLIDLLVGWVWRAVDLESYKSNVT